MNKTVAFRPVKGARVRFRLDDGTEHIGNIVRYGYRRNTDYVQIRIEGTTLSWCIPFGGQWHPAIGDIILEVNPTVPVAEPNEKLRDFLDIQELRNDRKQLARREFPKGTVVTFQAKGKPHTGRVMRLNQKTVSITNSLDMSDDTYWRIPYSHPDFLTISPAPVEVTP